MFSVESLDNFCVSIHIHSSAYIIITTVNYKTESCPQAVKIWGFSSGNCCSLLGAGPDNSCRIHRGLSVTRDSSPSASKAGSCC